MNSLNGGAKFTWSRKICNFRPITRYISWTIQDRHVRRFCERRMGSRMHSVERWNGWWPWMTNRPKSLIFLNFRSTFISLKRVKLVFKFSTQLEQCKYKAEITNILKERAWPTSRDPFLSRDVMLERYILWHCVRLSVCVCHRSVFYQIMCI